MDLKSLTPDLFVAGQLRPQEIEELAAKGIKTLIINRPDGEEEGQPDHASLEAIAADNGLEVLYIPVIPGNLTPDKLKAFERAMIETPAPRLAFCKTGTRSTMLWALTQASELETEEILRCESDIGYDLTALIPRLNARAGI